MGKKISITLHTVCALSVDSLKDTSEWWDLRDKGSSFSLKITTPAIRYNEFHSPILSPHPLRNCDYFFGSSI